MASFLVRWLAIVVAVLLADRLLPGSVVFADLTGVAIFAVVLALLNAVVRPLIALVALPITCLTLGLFTLVINGLMFWLAANLVGGVSVSSFGAAIVGAIIVSLVNLAASLIVRS